MRARYPILFAAYRSDEIDAYGNDVDAWDDPIERKIFGANAPETSEDITQGPNRLVITRTLLIPRNQAYSPRDRITLPDEEGFTYEVEGAQNSRSRNPFVWNPGGTLVVRRTDG